MPKPIPTVRFAPSPTGKLHVGNVRTALMNWLFAREIDGTFLLRIDDTDTERSTKEYESQIKTDLKWLGLNWDQTFNQSDRISHYDAAAQKLRDMGLLYPCYETAEELDRQRKLQRAKGQPPIYNRAALALSEKQIAEYKAQGRRPHWRFKLSGRPVSWIDLVRGAQKIETSSLSDPVLIRADGSYLYTLPSVVDDIDYNITHIVRGEDHVTNSGAQIEVFQALQNGDQAGSLPVFAHTPLLVGADGKGLSKRLGSLSMDQLRDQGIEYMSINSLLAKLGTSDPVEPRQDLEQLAKEFAFEKVGRAPARFDQSELEGLNAKLLHGMNYVDAVLRLRELGADEGEDVWNLLRANLQKFDDVAGWTTMLFSPMRGQIDAEDVEFCQIAARHLPNKIDENSWKQWTDSLKAETGRKGKGLFMPLRMALTGNPHGPAMNEVLVILGAETARGRLLGEVA